jgi:hypothetical protein
MINQISSLPHLARGLGGGSHEGAALVLGEIEAAAFGVIELHARLGLTQTVEARFNRASVDVLNANWPLPSTWPLHLPRMRESTLRPVSR